MSRGWAHLALALCGCAAAPAPIPPPPEPQPEKPAPAAAVMPAIEPIRMALTFDDLPRAGPDIPGLTRIQIHQQILDTLKKHAVPPVYGFVNGRNLVSHPEDRPALDAWLAAGNLLGNHTWAHSSPTIDLPAYLDDIDRNEPLLRELMPGPEARWKLFRYPSLMKGQTSMERAAIRSHLTSRGYRIAEVTVDFGDWAWNEPYARCLAKAPAGKEIDELKAAFLQAAATFLAFDDALARRVFRRPIAHVLLLHVGAFDALMLDELLTQLERSGVRFVTLDEALTDPIYAEDSGAAPTAGETLQEEFAIVRRVKLVPWAQMPTRRLDGWCR